MNPIGWIINLIVRRTIVRSCPKCGRAQQVPRSRAKQAVACKNCGAMLPPRP